MFRVGGVIFLTLWCFGAWYNTLTRGRLLGWMDSAGPDEEELPVVTTSVSRQKELGEGMCEPTFDDPKASRWADLYQKRARLTGQLPEPDVLGRMGIPPDHPFWKQDNADPSVGFVVNLEYHMGDALRAESPADIELVAVDDFQRTVYEFPLSETSHRLYFGFGSSIFELVETGAAIELNEFIWQSARAFRELLLEIESTPDDPENDPECEDEDEPMSFNPDDYTVRRIAWMQSFNAWYIITS